MFCMLLFLVAIQLLTLADADFGCGQRLVWRRSLLPSFSEINDTDDTKNEDPVSTRYRMWRLQSIHRGLSRSTADTIAGFGFVRSLAVNLLTARTHFRRLKPTVDALQNYLQETGISKEFEASFSTKMFDNLIILWRIQKQYRERNDVRNLALDRNRKNFPKMADASRYMRYATAAYGDEMISAVRWGRRTPWKAKLLRSTRQRISEHINVAEQDILIMDIDFGGVREHLHHFVAKDHANKAVVLAIRGTFSIPDMIVDAAGFSTPFCGGEAHSEMAQMAERTWNAARPYIVSALEEHPDYSLVITGHSLGAGTACLVNILCHRRGREQVLGREVRCFAYGSPPVFSPLELVADAVSSTTGYMHGNDIVPFLSISAVRRLISTLSVIDKESSKNRISRSSLVLGTSRPNKRIINSAMQGITKVPKKGAPTLAVPASSIIWTKERKHGRFDFKVCDPRKVAALSIPISKNAMKDHSLTSYEEALHYLDKKISINPATL